jgi:hypothetical protein
MRKIFYSLAVSSVLATTIFGDVNLSNGLVAHYEFEGNANDSSGNENHGTEHGGVSYVDGVIGQAGNFDGIDDVFELDNIDFPNKTISFSQWVKFSSFNSENPILDKHGAYMLRYKKNGELGFYIAGLDTLWGNIVLEINHWYHIIATYDGVKQKIYIDNKLIIEQDIIGILPSSNYPLYVLSDETAVYWYSDGLIDDLRIYNRALSEDEISELYNLRCSQENIYAKSPQTGTWLLFPTACDVPENWETSLSDENITVQNSWTSEKVENLSSGWTLNGTANKISDLTVFDSANIVWIFENGVWKAWSSDSAMKTKIENGAELLNEIPKDSGFWIQK